MGSSGGGGSQSSTMTYSPSPEERKLWGLQADILEQLKPYQIQTGETGYNLANLLLTGKEPLPGYLGGLSRGLDETAVSDISRKAVKDLSASGQAQGIYDSGTMASLQARTAGDIRRAAYEYNQGNIFNLLNLALSGYTDVQQPFLTTSSQLGQELKDTGTRTTTTNYSGGGGNSPFMSSLMGGLGQGIGASKWLWGCWVAKEIFGSWEHPKTIMARYYINNFAPKWFKDFYLKYGERIANFIHNKSILKLLIRPLFEYFAVEGGKYAEQYAI